MSAKTTDLMGLAESLVAYGRKQGASEVEVSIGQGREFSVEVRDGDVESLTEAGAKDLALRVFVDGKAASASSSDFAKDTLTRLVDNAIARARLSGTDEYGGLPEKGELKVTGESLGIYDPAVLELSADKKVALAREVEALGLKTGKVAKSLGASFGTYEFTRYLANSKGFSGSYRKTSVSNGVSFQGGSGDNLIQDGWYDGSTRLAGLMSTEQIATRAVSRVARLVGARKVETCNVPVVFEPPVAARLLLGFLAQCIAGPSLARKQSFLLDSLGKGIGNDKVTIVDDGLLPGGPGTAPFDSEGVPARRTTIVEKGVLKSYLLDTYYGRKLKLASTGHAGGVKNLFWARGEATPEAIIASVEKGLLFTGTLGQGTVATTGDISIGAFGLWIEKGEIAFPVAEITVSGNLGELLKSIEMVGSDLEQRRSIAAPTIKVAEMTVGGKAAAPAAKPAAAPAPKPAA